MRKGLIVWVNVMLEYKTRMIVCLGSSEKARWFSMYFPERSVALPLSYLLRLFPDKMSSTAFQDMRTMSRLRNMHLIYPDGITKKENSGISTYILREFLPILAALPITLWMLQEETGTVLVIQSFILVSSDSRLHPEASDLSKITGSWSMEHRTDALPLS